jgi:hypothetical protein
MKEKEKYVVCPNCENAFDEQFDFCPHCGQRNKNLELKLKYFLGDFLSSTFNIDSKILSTLRLLIFYPGKLTKMFLAGKRAAYVPPVRLYIVVSLVYFTLLSLIGSDIFQTNSEEKKVLNENKVAVLQDDNDEAAFPTEPADTIPAQDIELNDNDVDIAITLDKLGQLIDEKDSLSAGAAETNSNWEKLLQNRLKRMTTVEGKRTFSELLRKYMSIGMFVLMPVTALIFKLLFYRKTYYIQHLVFVLHLQSMMYILFIVLNLLDLIFNDSFIRVLNVFLFLFILSVWIKKFYEISWGKTIWKSLFFMVLYWFSFGIFFIIVVMVSAWNL